MSSLYTLTFEKQILQADYHVPNQNVTIPHCRLYCLFNEDGEAGRFYTHLSVSYAVFDTRRILIRRQVSKGLFGKTSYLVFDLTTGREVAKLYYGLPFDSTSATIEIPGTPKYYWLQLGYEATSLLKPQTWLNYKARMSNGRNEIVFSGRFGAGRTTFSNNLNDKPLSGTITMKDPTEVLALICGLYVVECDLGAGYSEA